MRFLLLVVGVVCMQIGCTHHHETVPNLDKESTALKIVYLRKANDAVVSHCSCDDGRVTFPPQMDCPWCGCGWLFTCITCRKAFTFSEGVEIEATWEDIAREDIRNEWQDEPSEEDVAEWVAAMKEMLALVQVGHRYVILDGVVVPADVTGVEFDGWHAHHDLESLPHVDALSDQSVIDRILANRDYSHKIAYVEQRHPN